ncbi:sensor histidine kinase [Parapedobacter koreensis]|uniref:histidine kinase n=1 Tax=Parapedobacter koreensis TaxID=332977 RepID=A0A1H7T3U5_9SPHI|nr:ATP-binding protein [Parapedobacter koreensis]SEL79398.1 two-component system, OmpR family, phosphate regulon sensor histidine kinase PhoR [Parapedobacter koreensis]
MRFILLVFINAFAVGLSIACVNFYFQHSWQHFFVTFAISLTISFLAFYYLFQRYIYNKIKLIYKLIHNLKLGKDLKEALGEKMSDDPINDVEQQVRDWAKEKKKEIDTLKEQERFRREFLANISHEFKTPLFAIQGYVDALQDGMMLEDPELATQFLMKASQNLDRLTFLIKDLDEISKLESGQIPINYERFDLVALIKEVLESMEDKAGMHDITLVFKEKYQHPMMVRADREKIRQVFVNLIDNSFKYGKTKGETNVRIYELFETVLVEVTDDGIGIEEKNLPRVFERFYRTDKSRSRKIGGSGLGLSIVKHIIEAHQQTINVRSTEGVGTTFAFTLEKVKLTI